MVSTIRKFELDKTVLPIDDLANTDTSSVSSFDAFRTISLRSRAEEEIVNDAKRKQLMMAIFEKTKNLVDLESCSGYSLDRLAGLRVLRLTQCNRVTDVSLKHSFRLRELKELSLAGCQQITSLGIASLVDKCPSLEEVDLSECHNIHDKTIEVLAVNLQRLRRLSLERCASLSDHTLDHLAVNCEQLRYLNVRGCRSMCSEPNMRLVSMQSLRDVMQSKPGPYNQNESFMGPPLPHALGNF